MPLKSHYWWDHTTKDFSELSMSEFVAVLPIAAVEQHGPHLPVRVDAAINAGIISQAIGRMPEDMKVLVLPMQPVGKSVEHIAYPGTLTMTYETLARVWFELAESVHRTGCRKIIFANSHGGNIQLMEVVAREVRVRLNMFAVATWISAAADLSDLYGQEELKYGIHGGESETSTMLHLHPDLIEMQYAEDFQPSSLELDRTNEVLRWGKVNFGWQAQDLHPSGACGDAASADAVRGATYVQRSAESFVSLCQEVLDYPMNQVTQATMFNAAK